MSSDRFCVSRFKLFGLVVACIAIGVAAYIVHRFHEHIWHYVIFVGIAHYTAASTWLWLTATDLELDRSVLRYRGNTVRWEDISRVNHLGSGWREMILITHKGGKIRITGLSLVLPPEGMGIVLDAITRHRSAAIQSRRQGWPGTSPRPTTLAAPVG